MTEWQSPETAPKDGTEILLLIEHFNAKYCPPEDAHLWTAGIPGRWIDHNGGGFTWFGLCGEVKGWQPLDPPPNA